MDDMMNITVSKLLEQVAKQYPDDEAVKFTDRDYRRTWKEFNEEAETIAKGFLEMGIQKGDHVAIWATNVPEWMLTFFACTKIGAVLVTVNTAYKVFELEYLLRQSDSKMLVMIDNFKKNDYIQIVNELCPTLKDSKRSCTPEIKIRRLPACFIGKNCIKKRKILTMRRFKLFTTVSILRTSATCSIPPARPVSPRVLC